MTSLNSERGSPLALSVVMPSLNQARFIGRSIRSVVQQDVAGIELIVMDGGSTDGTLALLASTAAEYPELLRWFSRPDSGPAQAICTAIVEAKAPVIGWLNSDDIYVPGAAQRALEFFRSHPEHVMVYGEALHIDLEDREIAPYPTLRPEATAAAFADGCFICQPSVFFRKEAFLRIGGLDESLKASFDMDLWLRFFLAYPRRIGWLPQVQACSRLHDDTITARAREQVAMESMTIIKKHLGPPPAHWMLTHLIELCDLHPFEICKTDLRAALLSVIEKASPLLEANAIDELYLAVDNNRQVQLSSPNFYANVYPDGWAGEVLELRVRQPQVEYSGVWLSCSHSTPTGGPLRLEVEVSGENIQSYFLEQSGDFELWLDFSNKHIGFEEILTIRSLDTFSPAEWQEGSEDRRRLAFKVNKCELLFR